jgi:hypothetical protein
MPCLFAVNFNPFFFTHNTFISGGMVMKKLAILAAVLMLIPASVMAGMNILNESSLNDVTGQVGITIDQTLEVNGGYLAWTDSDGTTDFTTQGVLVLDGLAVNNGGAGNTVSMTGLTIDAGTDGTVGKLVIGLPSFSGDITITKIALGATVAAAQADEGLGSVTIGNLSVAQSDVIIYSHN